MGEDEERGSEDGIAGPPVEVKIDQPCISCGRRSVVNMVTNLDIPYLGAAMQTTYMCRDCGFRHSDLIALENKGPMRYEATVSGTDDLDLRVVRSNSGTIRIPELGVDIEPGIASESFITNAEGILERVGEVISTLMADAEQDVHQKCNALLEELEMMKRGERPFRLVVEDPYGNSAIIGDGVVMTRMSEEEAEGLQKGEITFNYRPLDTGRHDTDGGPEGF